MLTPGTFSLQNVVTEPQSLPWSKTAQSEDEVVEPSDLVEPDDEHSDPVPSISYHVLTTDEIERVPDRKDLSRQYLPLRRPERGHALRRPERDLVVVARSVSLVVAVAVLTPWM
jgi:hypothetical protein